MELNDGLAATAVVPRPHHALVSVKRRLRMMIMTFLLIYLGPLSSEAAILHVGMALFTPVRYVYPTIYAAIATT